MPKMPLDDNNYPVPVLAARSGGAKQGSAQAATSAIGPFGAGTRVIEIYADEKIRYEIGGADVEASGTSHLLAAGERHTRAVPEGHTHVAIIRVGAADVPVDVSELE